MLSDRAVARLRDAIDAPDLAGTRYELLRELGRGGMGVVWVARDRELDREVALKVLRDPDPSGDLSERLKAEARHLARLEHPNIVPVYDAGALPDGRVYYAMRLVRGERLDSWCAGGRPRSEVLGVFRKICEAVAFANDRGVVHGDLKPENVMVGSFGEALLMDWGIARAAGTGGTIAGTPGYMAPEQARGEALDARSDVFALGALLRVVALEAPPPLTSIVRRATAPDPVQRYGGALELAEDVGRFLEGEAVSAHREGLVERSGRLIARHQVLLLLVVAYLVMRVLVLLV